MSAGHHVPSSGVPGRATIMDTPAGTALGSTRRDETADANDIVRAAKFTIRNLPCPAADPGERTLTFARGVGKRAQSTSFRPPCIIYYFLDLINKTPTRRVATFMSTAHGPATKLSRTARARPSRISRNWAESVNYSSGHLLSCLRYKGCYRGVLCPQSETLHPPAGRRTARRCWRTPPRVSRTPRPQWS